MKHISFSSLIFKEGGTYVAYCPQLDLSSCGASVDHARKMLREAVWLFIEEAGKMGTLRQILEETRHGRSSSCESNRDVYVTVRPKSHPLQTANVGFGKRRNEVYL